MNESSPERRSRVWLPATVAVLALLISGTVVLTRQGNTAPQAHDYAPTMVRLDVDSSTVQDHLDKCWETAQQVSTMVKYPDRSEWRPVLAITGGYLGTVTAIRTNGRPLFCETVEGGTTLSNPDIDPVYAAGSKTGAMLVTNAGTIAGVVDPSWQTMHVQATGQYQNDTNGIATQEDGLFVYTSYQSVVDGRILVGPDSPRIGLPPPPQPYGVVTPTYPAADRSTTVGQQLGQCINKSGNVPDSMSWRPGATVQANGERFIMATNNGGVSACLQRGQRGQFMPYLSRTPSPLKPSLLPVTATVGGRQVVAGLVPSGATEMHLTLTNGNKIDANVHETTFAALLPTGLTDTHGLTCELVGSSNQILYIGPVT